MSKLAMLFALAEIVRPVPGAEKVEGQPMPTEAIAPGRVFDPTDADQSASLMRMLAAREATDDEVTVETERRKREGEDASESTIVASEGAMKPKAATKAQKAAAEKAGTDPLL